MTDRMTAETVADCGYFRQAREKSPTGVPLVDSRGGPSSRTVPSSKAIACRGWLEAGTQNEQKLGSILVRIAKILHDSNRGRNLQRHADLARQFGPSRATGRRRDCCLSGSTPTRRRRRVADWGTAPARPVPVGMGRLVGHQYVGAVYEQTVHFVRHFGEARNGAGELSARSFALLSGNAMAGTSRSTSTGV